MNKFQTFAAAGNGLSSISNAIDEVLAGDLQRLFLLDVRDVTVAVMIG